MTRMNHGYGKTLAWVWSTLVAYNNDMIEENNVNGVIVLELEP